MFEDIKEFIGRVRKGMFDKRVIGTAIASDIAVSDEMGRAQRLWKELYEESEGLHLPAAISFEMARLITVEMNSKISGGKRGDFLDRCYQRVIENIRIPLEYGCAKGGLAFKPYVSGGKIKVDFIQADKFFPTEFDETGKIRGAIFVQTRKIGSKHYTRLERHRFSGNTYEISNQVFCSNNQDYLGKRVPIGEVEEWKELAESLSIKNVTQPLFGYFRPAIANTIDSTSALGVSVYANAVNLIFDADKQYKRLLWEFESGERALIANAMAFKRDKDGRPRLPDKRLYRTLEVEDMDFFREWSPQLREGEITKGLNRILRQIEFNCGFAYGTLSEISDTEKTAEEIRASKQRSYVTISDNQKALKNALLELVYAMDVWCTLYNLAPKGDFSVSFDFDDSIVADRKMQFEEKKALVSAGIMERWEFRMWYFGEDEETAKAKTAKTAE